MSKRERLTFLFLYVIKYYYYYYFLNFNIFKVSQLFPKTFLEASFTFLFLRL